MGNTGKFLIFMLFSILLIIMPPTSSAQDTMLPILVIGMQVADGVVPIIRPLNAQTTTQAIPVSVGFTLRAGDVIDLPGQGELILSCSDGRIENVRSNEQRSVDMCMDGYALSESASVYSWEGFAIHEVPRSSIPPEITYPGNTILTEPPEQLEWFYDTSTFIDDVNFAITVEEDFIPISDPITRGFNRDSNGLFFVSLPSEYFSMDGNFQIEIVADGERDFGNNNTRSIVITERVEFCIQERATNPPDVDTTTMPLWLDMDGIMFRQAIALFSSGYYADALNILLDMEPPILPEQVPISDSSAIRAMVDRTSLISSPMYYILLGDIYHNLGVRSFASHSYFIGEVMANEMRDNLSLANILLRRAEILRGDEGDISTDINITDLYDQSAILFSSLGYLTESQNVIDERDRKEDRTPSDPCVQG